MEYAYHKATINNLKKIWSKNINNHEGDERWVLWEQEAILNNSSGKAVTFVVLHHDEPIGEGTLLFSPTCSAINGRTQLCDNKHVANINALRVEKKYENKGHISRLIKEMESYAISLGYSRLTIGVEARETRNLAIYLHWGFDKYIMSEVEEEELVLYYEKKLKI